MRGSSRLIAAAAALIAGAAGAAADDATDSLSVSVNVAVQCEIEASDIDFGLYDPNGDAEAVGEIEVRCTPGTFFRLHLGPGQYGSINDRRMSNGSDRLSYNLYRDPQHRNLWGNASQGGYETGIGAGFRRLFRVYGRIPAGSSVGDGFYVDTVVAEIVY